jgi:hypothetical protein
MNQDYEILNILWEKYNGDCVACFKNIFSALVSKFIRYFFFWGGGGSSRTSIPYVGRQAVKVNTRK